MEDLHLSLCEKRKAHAKNNNCWEYFLSWNEHCTILKTLKGKVAQWLLWHDPLYTGGGTYGGWSEDQLEDYVDQHHQAALVGLKMERDLSQGLYWKKTMQKRKTRD